MGRPEELVRLAARAAALLSRVAGEVERELLRALEEALGVPLTRESLLLRSLYNFNPGGREDAGELARAVARYMGFESEEDVWRYLRRLGRRGRGDRERPGPGGAEGPG